MLLAAAIALLTPLLGDLPATLGGPWRATLASPGGELPFALEIDVARPAAIVRNGSEAIDVPEVRFENGELVLGFPYYDAEIRARAASGREGELEGTWTKRSGAGASVELPFRAKHGDAPTFAPEGDAKLSVAGRWSVRFSSSEQPAVGVFEQTGTRVTGTFLTATGDSRWLAGDCSGGRLRLACFDGAHAFLYQARAKADGTLEGEFYSGPKWKETWTAKRDDAAAEADTWNLAKWDDSIPLPMYVFPDLTGEARSLGEWLSTCKALVVVVFGSWCPNCHDEMRDLAELDRRLRPRGATIVGIAFETGGDFARDAQQVRRAALRHRASYPMLLGGSSKAERMAEALPSLTGLRAFPTTIFFHRDGRARAVHTGYSGPSTGAAHDELLKRFEDVVQELVDEPSPDERGFWSQVGSGRWIDQPNGFTTTIFHGDMSQFTTDDPEWADQVEKGVPLRPMRVLGPTVAFEERLYCFDEKAPAFLDPFDAGHRLAPELQRGQPTGEPVWTTYPQQVDENLKSKTARVRREAIFAAVRAVNTGERKEGFDPAPFLSDADPTVRAQAAWAAGKLHSKGAVAALVANAEHGFGPVRREVAHALALIGDPSSRATLEKLANDADTRTRLYARTGLDGLKH